MSYLLLISSLSNLGIESALISLKKEEIKFYLNVAWTLEFIKGVLTASIIFFTAELINTVVQKDLTSLIQLISIAPIILAFKNIRIAELRKDLNIKPLFFIELCQVISYVSFSFIFISYSPTTISVIYGYIIGCFTYSLLSYFTISYIPKFEFNRSKFSSIFNFSKWYILSTQISVLLDNSLQILSGRISSLAYLGNFERADFISRKSSGQIGEIFWKFALPAFSNLENPRKLFLSMNGIMIMLSTYFSFFILLYGENVINFLNPNLNIKEFLLPLFLISIISSFSVMPSILLVSKGKTSHLFSISLLRLLIIASLIIYFYSELTIITLIYIYMAAYFFNLPQSYFYITKIIDLDVFDVIKPAIIALAGILFLSFVFNLTNIYFFLSIMFISLIFSLNFFIDNFIGRIQDFFLGLHRLE